MADGPLQPLATSLLGLAGLLPSQAEIKERRDHADEILRHLGGGAFLEATGARQVHVTAHGVRFRLRRGVARSGINSVEVRREAPGAFTILFRRVSQAEGRGPLQVECQGAARAVHGQALPSIFTQHTGLSIPS